MTFDIDANGILKVTALDKATSRSQNITITASSGLSESEIEKMKKDAEAHAADDQHRKDLIEARNQADSIAYSTEKLIKENGDKIPAETKTQLEESVKKLKDLMNTDDPDAIKKATEELSQQVQQVGASMYQQAGPQAGPEAGPASDAGSTDGGTSDDDDVVDGEFKNA